MKYVRAKSLASAEKKVAAIVKKRNKWHTKKEAVGSVKCIKSKTTVNGQKTYKFTTRQRRTA